MSDVSERTKRISGQQKGLTLDQAVEAAKERSRRIRAGLCPKCGAPMDGIATDNDENYVFALPCRHFIGTVD